jgi:hypothetical protein
MVLRLFADPSPTLQSLDRLSDNRPQYGVFPNNRLQSCLLYPESLYFGCTFTAVDYRLLGLCTSVGQILSFQETSR